MFRILKYVQLLIIFTFILNTSIKADGWQWLKPYPQGNSLEGISFIATVANRGYAVGDLGTVIRTNDNGVSWEIIDIGTTENLNDVFMHDDIMIFIVGDNGSVYFLFDEDSTIVVTKQTSGTTENLNTITSHVNGCQWIVGDNKTVLRSTDLGVTWDQKTPLYNLNYNSIHNIECTDAWVCGPDGFVMNTTDWGISWTSHATPTSYQLFDIDMGQFEHIRAVGFAGTMILTTDEGITWNVENTGTFAALYDVHNIGIARAYAVGADGTILETTDVGAAWEQRVSNTRSTLYDIEDQFGTDNMWVCGRYGNVLRNNGIGTDFELMTGETKYWMGGVEFINADTGWVVGGERGYGSKGIILKTTNGGESWDVKLENPNLWNLDFINGNKGCAVGEDGEIWMTGTGGDIWGNPSSPISTDLYAVHFVDENNGWISGRYGEILHTTTGGTSWIRQTSNTLNPLWGIHFVNELKGWACGLDTTIMQTADGGQTWSRHNLNGPKGATLFDVFFINDMRGWVVGSNGTIYITINGGENWNSVESGTNATLLSIHFVDVDNGWISGDAGTVLKTTDSGATWNPQFTGVATNGLLGIYFTDLQNGWAVGEGGTILSTNDGGGPITNIEDEQVEIPTQFLLSQNFPNPFNPSTIIKYQIPGQARDDNSLGLTSVSLDIFDILGKHLVRLVDEKQEPGHYEVTWDASGFSSGIYFYRINVGKSSETKKMVLLK